MKIMFFFFTFEHVSIVDQLVFYLFHYFSDQVWKQSNQQAEAILLDFYSKKK